MEGSDLGSRGSAKLCAALGAAILAPAPLAARPVTHAAPVTTADRAVTVVAVVDSGFSPYHLDFAGFRHPWNTDADAANDLDLDADPAAYVDAYPGAAVLPVTVPASAADAAATLAAKDAAAWASFVPSTLDHVSMYRLPGTKIIGAINFDAGRSFYADNDAHGTRSASVAAGNRHGTCPECLLVLIRDGPGNAGLRWAASQPWIDVVSNSYGNSAAGDTVRTNVYLEPIAAATKAATEAGQTIVFSAGNGLLNSYDAPQLTYWSSEKGPDWIVTVGATTSSTHQEYSGVGKPVDISAIGADYPSAGGPGADGNAYHSGTSNAAAVVAGTFGYVVQRARESLGDQTEAHGSGIVASGARVACGAQDASCPLSDGVLTREELHRTVFTNVSPGGKLILVTAAWPNTEYAYFYVGHGVVLGAITWQTLRDEQRRFSGALAGTVEPLARPKGESAWFEVDSKCRQRLWGPWSGGYYRGVDPSFDPAVDQLAMSFNAWCSRAATGFARLS